MDKLNTFTSTGIKLLMRHPKAVNNIIEHQRGTPISLQIAPTSKCNLNCSFCSNTNRSDHEDLDLSLLSTCLSELALMGTKTVEFTGGGDPTMYPVINELISRCRDYRFQMGMITNGIALKKNIKQENLNRLHWIRISMNCLDYVDDIDIPDIDGTLGFSYVMNDKTNVKILGKLHEYVRRYNVEYVRIVPNCQASDEEQAENNVRLSALVQEWGPPYFYQTKTFHKPEKCFWGYMKPFLLHDGYVYPCSSIVLNESADRSFHEKYRWVKIEDLPNVYKSKMKSYPTKNCNHCVFSKQNNMVQELMEPCKMENFI